MKKVKRNRKPVVLISLDGYEVIKFDSINECAKTGLGRREIQRCLKGVQKQTCGYKVKAYDEEFIKLWKRILE